MLKTSSGERHAWSTPPCDHGLQRSSRQPALAEPLTRPCLRSASIAYCEQLGWYLQRARRDEQAERPAVGVDERDPERRRRRAAARRESRGDLPEHLVDALGEPLVAARLGRLGQPGPDDEHVVVRRGRSRPRSSLRAPDLPQLALDPVADDALPAAFGTARPSRGSPGSSVALRTSRASGSASRPTGRAGRRRRSRGSGRGGSCAARCATRPLGRQALAPLGAAALEDRRGRHASTCARGSRACASAGVRLADKSVSSMSLSVKDLSTRAAGSAELTSTARSARSAEARPSTPTAGPYLGRSGRLSTGSGGRKAVETAAR